MDLNIYRLYGENGFSTAEEATDNYANLFLNNGNDEDIMLTYYDIVNSNNGISSARVSVCSTLPTVSMVGVARCLQGRW